MLEELIQLERRLGGAGHMSISAPEGKHDDMAAVLALAAFKAVWLTPTITPTDPDPEPTLFERGMATIKKHRQDTNNGASPNFYHWD
jgi:hypothetical protein